MSYTACYTKLENGYMGQLLEWPEVVTEAANIDECRETLIDAVHEMQATYAEDGMTPPPGRTLFEQIAV